MKRAFSIVFLGTTLGALLCPSVVSAGAILATAQSFAVLGDTVTNTGSTGVTGDLGVTPGTSVTGFPPGTVDGTIHLNDQIAQDALADATTAYNTLTGLLPFVDLTGQDLGGMTLTPGVYKFSTSAALTGNLTLDFQDKPNMGFVFQIGSTLTTSVGSNVIVSNGTPTSGLYWQVGTSATLGTSSAFAGNILADQSITLNTGASLLGRAFARVATVTLDTNLISNNNAQDFGSEGFSGSTVPEPSVLLLFGTAFAGLAGSRSRGKRSQSAPTKG